MNKNRFAKIIVVFLTVCLAATVTFAESKGDTSGKKITLRAWGVPSGAGASVSSLAQMRILEAFQKKNPDIIPVSTTGLQIPGRTMDIAPLMQIAGDIAPHVLYVNFRQSDTYIGNKFLYPLDKYIEQDLLGIDKDKLKNAHLLELDDYLKLLQTSPRYATEIAPRIPRQCWEVMRRKCPYGKDCPYCKQLGVEPGEKHYHIWCFPQGPLVMALFYRRDMFNEAGLPDRVPQTMEEFLQWARKLTNPSKNCYGFQLRMQELSWSTLSFLYSMGGSLVVEEDGQWRCNFDSEQAIEAYHYVARLLHEPFKNKHGKFDSVVYIGDTVGAGEIKYGMFFGYIDQRFFMQYDPAQYGFGPAPKHGATGKRGSEFNSMMTGIYAGIEDKDVRDAAWKYIHFYDGPQARKIRATVFVNNGLGNFVQPELLKAAGFPEYVRKVPKEWITAYSQALKNGVPEPYGTNCQMVYTYASKALNQIRTDDEVKEAVREFDAERAKVRIREILVDRVKRGNEKMLNILDDDVRKERDIVAYIVAVVIFTLFVLLFRKVFKTFSKAQPQLIEGQKKGWQFGKYKWAYMLVIPAVATVALWRYYPLVRGSIIAFQNYNIRGFSEFVGIANFSNALYDDEFWHAMWVTFKYAAAFAVFGFTSPIILALLLTEVPKGKVLFRTIYYIPAVLSGVVVMFLWKNFFGSYGAVNEIANICIEWVNHIAGSQIAEVHTNWLDDRTYALFCILIPVVWVQMGPGCLIYLAALKTVPEEIYEAADIDGAGVMNKIFYITLPSIKALIMINFIGVMVATFKGGSQFVLAMTGGGPYTPYGQTEFVGLHIYFQAFGYLRFGSATAMAWILGSMLVGFTVFQLQRLSRMEFKTAGSV